MNIWTILLFLTIGNFGSMWTFFFWDKTPRNSNIILSQGNEIISNPETCADIFNNFFSDAVEDLDIDRALHIDCMVYSDDHVKSFKNHPSIHRILQEGYSENNFSFDPNSESSIHSVIINMDGGISNQQYTSTDFKG